MNIREVDTLVNVIYSFAMAFLKLFALIAVIEVPLILFQIRDAIKDQKKAG